MRARVALMQCLEDITRIALVGQRGWLVAIAIRNHLASQLRQSQARDVGLEVSRVGKVLGPTRPLEIHSEELSRKAVAPAANSAIDEDARANPGTERDEHEILDAARHSTPMLANRGHVGVIVEKHRDPEGFFQFPPHVLLAPSRDVVGIHHLARLRVDAPWHSNRDAAQGSEPVFALDQPGNSLANLRDDPARPCLRVHPLARLLQNLPLDARQHEAQMARPHVDGDPTTGGFGRFVFCAQAQFPSGTSTSLNQTFVY